MDHGRAPAWLLLVLTCLAPACAPRYQHVVERPLSSGDTLVCPGYLVWNNAPVRDVFLVINGSCTRCRISRLPRYPRLERTDRTRPRARSVECVGPTPRHDISLLPRWTLGERSCAIRDDDAARDDRLDDDVQR